MKWFLLEQSACEFYTSHAGLALIGLCVNTLLDIGKTLKRALLLLHGIPHGNLIKAYLGLLCLGKSDFGAIENCREDRYYM